MNGRWRVARKASRLVLAVGTAALSVTLARHALAAGPAAYEFTIEKALTPGQDLVLSVGVKDGQLAERVVAVGGRPYAPCQIVEDGLKLERGRLAGPLRIAAGPTHERVELNAALDAGGTYSRAEGAPDGPREPSGVIRVEPPDNPTGRRWVLWLSDAMGPGIGLGLVFTIDRAAKTLAAEHGWASGYNQGHHRMDASKLTFDGTNVAGEMGIVIVPDGSSPAHGQHTDGRIQLRLSLDAYAMEDGTPLPPPVRGATPDAKFAAHYARRTRTVAMPIPADALVKGRNVLALAIRRAAISGPVAGNAWNPIGFRQAIVGSLTGSGAIPYPEAIQGTRVWSAEALDPIAESPAPKSLLTGTGGIGRSSPVKGIQYGNPFDPLRPIRILVPRNGVGSGQAVLSDPAGLRDVSATLRDLKGPGDATIPASAAQVRYAVQHGLTHLCDGLMARPPDAARTVPVWLIVRAPRDAAPGWYASTLDLQANGQRLAVPVQLLVTPVVVPDSRDFVSAVSLSESPENVALHYGVKCWSDGVVKASRKQEIPRFGFLVGAKCTGMEAS